jgi:UDP-glucose 4-epimerase
VRILLTGSASHLARVTLPVLCQHEAISRVIGIDIKPSHFRHAKYEERLMDIRSPDIADVFHDIDCVIHMAFIVMRGALGRQRHDRGLMHDINVNGSIHVFRQAARHNISTLVHLSSAVVYGPGHDTPAMLTEQQPLRPLHGFAYAEDKVTLERWLDQWQLDTTLRIVRLRPHAILGRHAQPLLKQILNFPIAPKTTGNVPLLQCIWENDVAHAIVQSIFSGARGCFNLSTHESLSFREMQQHLNKHALKLPYPWLRQSHRLAWRITGRFGEPGWMQALQFPLTLDNSRAARMLGWQPTRTLTQCLDLMRSK